MKEFMRLAVMQPYFFPYLGYFQLINAADTFVFLDDVSYINGGWINRNRILIQGKAKYMTIPCRKASQNKWISEIDHDLDNSIREKIVRKISTSYAKAPFFNSVFSIFKEVLYSDYQSIASLSILSVNKILSYLELERRVLISSETFDNYNLNGENRIINFCESVEASVYINMIGGKQLYSKQKFREKGISLKFLTPQIPHYEQFNDEFVQGLSILDILMFNSADETRKMLNQYTVG